MAGDNEARARAVLAEMQFRIAEGPTSALGIGEVVTPEEVRGAFLALTKQFHPARFGRLAPDVQRLANEVFLGIKGAHDHMLKVLGSSARAARPGATVLARGTDRGPGARPSQPVLVAPPSASTPAMGVPVQSRTETGPMGQRPITGSMPPLQAPHRPSSPSVQQPSTQRPTGSMPTVQPPATQRTGSIPTQQPATQRPGAMPPLQQPATQRPTTPAVQQPGPRQTGSIPIQQPGPRQTGSIPIQQPGPRQTGSIPIQQPRASTPAMGVRVTTPVPPGTQPGVGAGTQPVSRMATPPAGIAAGGARAASPSTSPVATTQPLQRFPAVAPVTQPGVGTPPPTVSRTTTPAATMPPRPQTDGFNPPTVRGVATPPPQTQQPRVEAAFDESAAFRQAAALMEAKDWTAARIALHALAAKVPQSKHYRAWLCYARGREAFLNGKRDEALAEMQRALQLDPDLAHAKHALAELQRRR